MADSTRVNVGLISALGFCVSFQAIEAGALLAKWAFKNFSGGRDAHTYRALVVVGLET